jgi:hypothetical protein
MLCEMAAFITVMSSRVRIRSSYQSGLWNVFSNAYNNHRQDLIEAVEELQQEFHCCGVVDAQDYVRVNRTVPVSCRLDQSPLQPIFAKGCADAFVDWMWDELPVIAGVISAIFFIEVFGVIAAFSLAAALSHYAYGKLEGSFVSESTA